MFSFITIIAIALLTGNVFSNIPWLSQQQPTKTLVAQKSVKAATSNSVLIFAEPIVKSDLPVGQFDITIRMSTNGNDIAGIEMVLKSSSSSTLELTGFTPSPNPISGYSASFLTIANQPLSSGELYLYAGVNPTNSVFTGDSNNTLTLGTLHARMKKIGTENLLVDVNTSVTSHSNASILVANAGGQIGTYTVPGPTNTPTPIPTNTPVPTPTATPVTAAPVIPTTAPLVTVVPSATPLPTALPTCSVSFAFPASITPNTDVPITLTLVSPTDASNSIWGYSTLYELDSQGKVLGSLGGCPNNTCTIPAAKNTAGAHRIQFAVRDAQGYNDQAIKLPGQAEGQIWCTTQGTSTFTSATTPTNTPVCPGKIKGDSNNDCKVDEADYQAWFTEITTGTGTTADFNGNGLTDVLDFNIWRKNFFNLR